MLIPKLLFQGKVDVDKDGLNFDSYSFDFLPLESITITSHKRKLADMMEKIKNELKGEPFLLSEETVTSIITSGDDKLIIDWQTALLLAGRMTRSGNEDIALGSVWINILALIHGSESANDEDVKEFLLKIINNQMDGYINYTIDEKAHPRRDMKHVFYIPDYFKTKSTQYKIWSKLSSLICDLLMSTIDNLFIIPLLRSEIQETTYGKDDVIAGTAFILSESKFRSLVSVLKTKSIKAIAQQKGSAKSASVPQSVQSAEVAALSPPVPQEESLLVKTEKYLKENVFTQRSNEIPQYQEKADLLNRVKTKFLEVRDIDALVSLYDFINKPQNKKKLNMHRNFGDNILLNFETKGWQDLIAEIRTHALNVLFEKYNLQESLATIEAGQNINVADPAMFAEHLSLYSKTKLFSQHRSNMNFFNLFHSTQAVGKIKKVVAACECQMKLQTPELKPN